jgi:hypothetical protein
LAVDFIFSRPIFSTTHFVDVAGIPRETALRMLRVLRGDDARVLKTIRQGSGRRPAIVAFSELLNIAEGRRVPLSVTDNRLACLCVSGCRIVTHKRFCAPPMTHKNLAFS